MNPFKPNLRLSTFLYIFFVLYSYLHSGNHGDKQNHVAEGFDTSWILHNHSGKNRQPLLIQKSSDLNFIPHKKRCLSTSQNFHSNHHYLNMKSASLVMLSSSSSESSLSSLSSTSSIKSNIFPLNEKTNQNVDIVNEKIPSTYPDAFKRFFFGPNYGPMITSLTILFLIFYRINLFNINSTSTALINNTIMNNCLVSIAVISFWLIQEHFLHKHLLHSKINWIGKEIHKHHHNQPYFHISIDSTPLLLGWLFIASLLLHLILPQPLALTGTIFYSIAGMWYEWTHYIVHTKVKPRSKVMKEVKHNHIRHHLLSEDYWLGFSLPFVDDLFGTNPSVESVRKNLK